MRMVDVVAGKMTIREINREVVHYMIRHPERLRVDVELINNEYQVVIWIDEKTFKGKC